MKAAGEGRTSIDSMTRILLSVVVLKGHVMYYDVEDKMLTWMLANTPGFQADWQKGMMHQEKEKTEIKNNGGNSDMEEEKDVKEETKEEEEKNTKKRKKGPR
jgi:uncharacterized protein CbrC (UPF0167 family)